MKNLNLFNLKSIVRSKAQWLLTLIAILTLGTGQMWGTDYYLRYMANMPSGNYDGNTSQKLTQFGSTNRYYCELNLTASTQYGFFIRVDDSDTQCWKADATATTNQEVTLSSYGGQHGNSNHRVSYTTSTAGTYIFTYDIDNHKISVSPKSSQTVKVAWSIASGHDGDWNLGTYTQLSQEGSTAKYSADVDITSAAKHYLFVQTDNNRYWKSTAAITAGSYAYVYDYGTNNFGNSGDKLNFTPSATGKYRFTWDHDAKMITYQRLYQVTYNANSGTGTTPESSYHLSGSTVTVAGSGTMSKSSYTFSGWNTANNGSGTNYTAGSGTFTMPASNKTLYAKWTQSVTLNANTSNGGRGSNGSATATWNGTALSSISHPSGQTGYTCTGYFTEATGGTKVLNADGTYADNNIADYITAGKWSRTEATTLYAQWDNHYTVTFEQGSPTFQGTGDVTATYGAALPAISVPSKTGYIFGGYYTGENGTGKQYYNENGVGLINWVEAANTTLHAKWTGISYQVAFDANEGSGTIDNQDFTYGAAATALTSNTTQITRTGYYFLGWNTNADGSGTAFYNGKSVQNLTSVDGGIVTLYAQWAKTYTLYFLNEGTSGWNQGANAGATTRYAYAYSSYDGHKLEPLGAWTNNSSQGKQMTAESGITLSNVSGGITTWCWSIAGVPEGATIIFSDNTSSKKTIDLSGWTSEKPYYCNGNGTWYALDGTNTISKMTEMSVHLILLTGSDWPYTESTVYDCGIDLHGSVRYAVKELPAGRYKYKYYNWRDNKWSGCGSDGQYIMDMNQSNGYNAWDLNGTSGGYNVYFYTTVSSGEYKFKLDWVGAGGTTPKSTLYYPVGVGLSLSTSEAITGATTTVRLTASPQKNYLITNPTYSYQISRDNGNSWATITETSNTTYDYTFAAETCKFRVVLKNDEGLSSKSTEQSFSTHGTKSFYVYNPYNNSTNNWRWLHLYTWDSNHNNQTYNGSWPGGYIHCTDPKGTKSTDKEHDNEIEAMGNDWFYITIDDRANCFMLVGETPYNSHQTITCYVNNYIEGGKYMIYTENNQNKVVEYQAKGASDFRLKYTDGGTTRYSDIYNTTLDGTSVTASMWMDANSSTASLALEQGNGENSWTPVATYSNSTSDGFGSLVDIDHRSHGYVFQMDLNLSTPAVSNVTEYTGPFYVRTDGLEGGWNAYKNNPKNTMHHSTGSLTGTPAYDYYLCKWIGSANTNVKFTVANDYNKELVASLGHDANSTDPLSSTEKVPTPTNVRFSWDSQTNTLTRAYLSGATDASSRFLVMVEKASGAGYTTGKIYNENGVALTTGNGRVSGLNEHELLFADNGNWVYQLDMKANPGAQAKVTAKYNNQEPEFIPTTTLIGGSGESMYKYRITYDFKTNIMTNAWVADGSEINTTIDLKTNVMIIRNGQAAEGVTQIRFGDGDDKKIINAKKLISVMEFKYNDMVGTMNTWNSQAYQFCMYYISFPFDVNVSDIFGIGTYGTDWKLQYYDGAERASKGFFRGDGTTTFWKDVPANGKLDKHVGYSLLLNRVKFNDRTSDIWENKGAGSSVYLYFPSTADAETIKDDGTVTIHVPEHPCGINRTFTVDDRELNHMNTDSHWNMMGTPLFEHKTASTIAAPAAINDEILQYFYAWNYADNTLSVKADLTDGEQTFNAMHAYMVQYAGDVTFSGAAIYPAGIAARRTAETRNLNIELQVLNANEEEINRTYVQLKDGADADFKLNEDMYMVTNSRAVNIYTYAGDYDVAANVLPLETTTVPVGVMVKTAGSYIFSMPSDFSGTVTLVDSFAQTRTNLAVEDYTVDLEKGTFNDRFLLEININKVPTAIDGVPGGSLKDGKAHKFIENGAMYILQDGKIYDARGNRLQ